MANRSPRNPGPLQGFEERARLGGVPSAAVHDDGGAASLAQLGGSVGARLKRMADGAAQREGDAAGRAAGARAGEKFVEKTAAEARGVARGPGSTPSPPKPQTAAGDSASPPDGLSDTPLQLRGDGTIRGGAFDAAAIQAFGWRMQTGLTNDLAAAYQENQDSPGGYEKAVAEIQQRFLGSEPELLGEGSVLRETFDQVIAQKLPAARLAIQARYEAKIRAEARAAASEGVAALRGELERDAYNLGANPQAAELLAGRQARLNQQIAAGVRSGTFTRKEGEQLQRSVETTVLEARTAGTFDALGDPAAQKEFALGIMKDYAAAEGPFGQLSLEQAQQLSDGLYRKATANETRARAANKAEAAALEALIDDDVASIAGSGAGLDAATLDPERVAAVLGREGVEKWRLAQRDAQRGYEATAGMEIETPAELAARLEALTPAPGQPGYADAVRVQAAAAKQATAILEERQKDPLGQAHRGGLIELKPIDPSSPEALSGSLAARRDAAQAVAATYGIAPVVFRPEERVSLSRALIDTPELIPAFAGSVSETLGPLAPAAMAEISEHGPVLALAGQVALDTGSNGVAQDVAAVLAGKRDKTWSVKLPESNAFATASRQVLGPALSEVPDLQQAVLSTANLLFEREVAAQGLDPGKVGDSDNPAHAAYEQAIERALGARQIGGEKWGGLAEVNGRRVRAPSFMPARDLQRVLDTLGPEDLAALGPIATANGVDIRPAEIRRGKLVTLGDGVYGVALGDPDSFDPQFVLAPGGLRWELDIAAIRRNRADRPEPRVFPGMGGR